jgi:hypothetical protein
MQDIQQIESKVSVLDCTYAQLISVFTLSVSLIEGSQAHFKPISEGQSCDGEIIDPIPAISMTAIHDVIPCGKRGGPTFAETIKIDP